MFKHITRQLERQKAGNFKADRDDELSSDSESDYDDEDEKQVTARPTANLKRRLPPVSHDSDDDDNDEDDEDDSDDDSDDDEDGMDGEEEDDGVSGEEEEGEEEEAYDYQLVCFEI